MPAGAFPPRLLSRERNDGAALRLLLLLAAHQVSNLVQGLADQGGTFLLELCVQLCPFGDQGGCCVGAVGGSCAHESLLVVLQYGLSGEVPVAFVPRCLGGGSQLAALGGGVGDPSPDHGEGDQCECGRGETDSGDGVCGAASCYAVENFCETCDQDHRRRGDGGPSAGCEIHAHPGLHACCRSSVGVVGGVFLWAGEFVDDCAEHHFAHVVGDAEPLCHVLYGVGFGAYL